MVNPRMEATIIATAISRGIVAHSDGFTITWTQIRMPVPAINAKTNQGGNLPLKDNILSYLSLGGSDIPDPTSGPYEVIDMRHLSPLEFSAGALSGDHIFGRGAATPPRFHSITTEALAGSARRRASRPARAAQAAPVSFSWLRVRRYVSLFRPAPLIARRVRSVSSTPSHPGFLSAMPRCRALGSAERCRAH